MSGSKYPHKKMENRSTGVVQVSVDDGEEFDLEPERLRAELSQEKSYGDAQMQLQLLATPGKAGAVSERSTGKPCNQ